MAAVMPVATPTDAMLAAQRADIDKFEAQLKRPATVEEIKSDLRAHPVPPALNLRMHETEES